MFEFESVMYSSILMTEVDLKSQIQEQDSVMTVQKGLDLAALLMKFDYFHLILISDSDLIAASGSEVVALADMS